MSRKKRKRPKGSRKPERAEVSGPAGGAEDLDEHAREETSPGSRIPEPIEAKRPDRQPLPQPGRGTLETAIAGDARRYWILAGIAIGAAILLRLAYLRADPPWDFTWSQALFTDGARAIDGARNKMVFGQWIPDMRSPVVLFYPLVNLLAYAIFKVGGVGLAQANLVGALPALASVVLIFWWMRNLEGRLGGLVALVLLAFPFIHVVYSRVPMVEALLILMLLAAFRFALGGNRALLAAGLLCGLAAFMVKMHALHFVPVVLVFVLLERRQEPRRRKAAAAGAFLVGFVAAVAAWFVLVYIVNPEMIAKYFRSNILIAQQGEYAGAGIGQILTARVGAFIHLGSGRDGFFAEVPILSVMAYLGLLAVMSGFTGGRAASKPWERLAALWFVGLVAALSLLSYRPLRYMVLLTPPVVLLATAFLLRLLRGQPLLAPRKPKWFVYAFPVWLAWVLIHLQQDLIYRTLSAGAPLVTGQLSPGQISLYNFQLSVWKHILVYGGIAAGLTLIFKDRIRRARVPLGHSGLKFAGAGALLAFVVIHAISFADYAENRRYSIVDAAGSLERVLSEGVFLVGDCSTTLSLETRFRTLPSYGDLIRYKEKEAFEAYPITHFLLRFPTLFEYLRDTYPATIDRMAVVRNFALCGRGATVVRMPEWPGYARSGYVPSEYEMGMDHLRRGDVAEAGAEFERFLAKRPDSYEALSALALCHLDAGRIEEAESDVRKALELTDRDSFSHEIYGDILNAGGDRYGARAEWEKALELNPYSPSLQTKLGVRRR
jgi:4-amino-4-deoxy-L-arabinose transferase-like glycosyltransferase